MSQPIPRKGNQMLNVRDVKDRKVKQVLQMIKTLTPKMQERFECWLENGNDTELQEWVMTLNAFQQECRDKINAVPNRPKDRQGYTLVTVEEEKAMQMRFREVVAQFLAKMDA
jgi:hypothetical protein